MDADFPLKGVVAVKEISITGRWRNRDKIKTQCEYGGLFKTELAGFAKIVVAQIRNIVIFCGDRCRRGTNIVIPYSMPLT